MKFPLGEQYKTLGVQNLIEEGHLHEEEIIIMIHRHAHGDFGEVPKEDWKANEDAIKNGGRIVSSYTSKSGKTIWIITEADRSYTTVMLPHEY